jgi:trk system potassium uptake protein TrkA
MYIIIVGCGRVGSRLAELFSAARSDVVIIDTEPTSLKNLGAEFDGMTIIGDGTDQDIMEKAGASKADVFVATTNDDNVNLMACQVAKQVFNIKRVIARVNDPDREKMFKDLKIDATICPTSIAASNIRNAILYPNVISVLSARSDQIEVNEVTIKGSVAGKALKDLHLPKGCVISAIARGEEVLVPSGNTVLKGGDIAVVVNLVAVSEKVKAILTKG